jgi:hypothetical protein
MKKRITILLILFLVVVLACGLHLWIQTSPWLDDQQMLNRRDTEFDLVRAFATALRINDPAAYDMIDPSLKPRLDAWMNTHQSPKCISQADWFFVSAGTQQGNKITFGCYIKDSRLRYEIDNIVVKDMKVIDWGEVTEEDWAGNEIK